MFWWPDRRCSKAAASTIPRPMAKISAPFTPPAGRDLETAICVWTKTALTLLEPFAQVARPSSSLFQKYSKSRPCNRRNGLKIRAHGAPLAQSDRDIVDQSHARQSRGGKQARGPGRGVQQGQVVIGPDFQIFHLGEAGFFQPVDRRALQIVKGLPRGHAVGQFFHFLVQQGGGHARPVR